MKYITKNSTFGKVLCGITIMATLVSCSQFLDERPSKTTSLVVTTTDQLDALLGAYASFYLEPNRTNIFSSDDYGLPKNLYDARPGTFALQGIQFMLWDTEYLPDVIQETFWSGEYGKIFRANMVLSYLDRVSGPEDHKTALKAEAHFVRAYSYWTLANTYCLPYTEANKNELGLPLKTSTSFEEPYERQTLEATYNLIESDLQEALTINVPLMGSNGRARHWRANKAAVNGFAARYWLHRNNYTEALKYANLALAEHQVLVDYNTEMRYGRPSTVNINTGTPQAQTVTLQFPYTHDNQTDLTDMMAWKEFLYFRMLNHGSWWYVPSQELLDLYDQDNDLRFKYHMVQHYSYDRGLTNPSYSWPGYVFFFKDRLPSGPTVAEMILIKAEAQARTDDYNNAMLTVNQLRVKRMAPGAWVNLTAANKNEAIRKILEERRRELPFTHRWQDIRRFNNNDDPNDDVELSRDFYEYNVANVDANSAIKTYSLPKNSRRFATPIPRTEIISSQDRIVQNTY